MSKVPCPPDYAIVPGFGWCRVGAAGELIVAIGPGRWERASSGRWLFHREEPEANVPTTLNRAAAARLSEKQVLLVGLIMLPENAGKSLNDLAAILTALLPGKPTTHAAARKILSRLRDESLLGPDANARARELLRRRAKRTTPPSKIGTTIRRTGDLDKIVQLVEGAKTGKPGDRRKLARFWSSQGGSPKEPDKLG